MNRYQNNLASFKRYLESPDSQAITELTTAIQYGYNLNMSVFAEDPDEGWIELGQSQSSSTGSPFDEVRRSSGMMSNTWTELIENPDRLAQQFDLLAGTWPQSYDEVILVVDQDNQIRDLTLYDIGLKDPKQLADIRQKIEDGEEIESSEPERFTFSDVLGKEYRLLQPIDFYVESDDKWIETRDETSTGDILEDAVEVTIVGIIRPIDDAAQASINGTIAYPKSLTDHMMARLNRSEIIQDQIERPDINVLTGLSFVDLTELSDEELLEIMTDEEKMQLEMMPEPEKAAFITRYRAERADTYDTVMQRLGFASPDEPSSINLYLSDFDSRELVIDLIDQYNEEKNQQELTEEVIAYSDVVGLMTTSITDMIGIISYLLIGFVSISLVVSSIMIGIITYISVLERTKEIGILRSIGASKGDISRVFNAETALIGLASGVLGIVISVLLTFPINNLIERLSGAEDIAFLPPQAAVGLIAISLILTILAGLIPARMAAKKDPVIALRTE